MKNTYYLSTIPFRLLQELQEIGYTRTAALESANDVVTYAAVFDWFIEQDLRINMRCHKNPEGWVWNHIINDYYTRSALWYNTWQEGANNAIACAITIWKENNL